MLRWVRGKTKKDHIKNGDILREANIEPVTTFLGQKTTAIVSPPVKEEREDTSKKTITMQVQGKRTRGGPR